MVGKYSQYDLIDMANVVLDAHEKKDPRASILIITLAARTNSTASLVLAKIEALARGEHVL